MLDRILAGDRRALARAATLIENRQPAGRALLQQLFARTGRALVIGITGPPGAGKSTLTDQFIRHFRAEGLRVAVIAVDPTSPYSGGAILGDRIRMQAHHADEGVFIRSMATRGAMGGLAAATGDLVLLLDGAGWDVIIIETVGVGQDEVDVARLAQVVLVVLVPGMGDDVQAIKAGIMEIADVFLLNKADQPGIEKLEREVQNMLSLGHAVGRDRVPPLVRTIASEAVGIGEAVTAAREFAASDEARRRAKESWRHRLERLAVERILSRLPLGELEELAADVAARRAEPIEVIDGWIGKHWREN